MNPAADGPDYDAVPGRARRRHGHAGAGLQTTGEERDAARAAALLRGWFLDPETRQDPSFAHAQIRPGLAALRRTGLIEARDVLYVIDAAQIIASSDAWPRADQSGLRRWFGAFLTCARGARCPKRADVDNSETRWSVRSTVYAPFSGNETLGRAVVLETREIVAR